MDPRDLLGNSPEPDSHELSAGQKPHIYVKELSARDSESILAHLLDLPEDDRLLRFGSALSDALIEEYANRINFDNDKVFGVFNRQFVLVGVGHLAYVPRTQMDIDSDKERIAEFGVSVSPSARGKGVGSKLFERAAIHCRNDDIDTLYMQCLASNKTMIHIAKKAGMEIHREYGEADAYLRLPVASPSSVLKEAMEEQVASLEYQFKSNMRGVSKLLAYLTRWRKKG